MKLSQVKHSVRGVDPGLLVALAICLLALWPFLTRSALPQDTDAELHIYRLAELGRLFRAGEPFPRWAPNFYYGYGYPIFNYYAPLAYYVGLIPELTPFWDAVDGVKIVFVLGLMLGGLGIYGYCARNWGRLPALVATAAYVYAPFIVFIDPHARGDLAEAFSFAVFPLSIWALDRLRSRPSTLSWLAAVGLIALVILSHNLMALVFAAILAGWCLWVYLLKDVPPALSLPSKLFQRLINARLILALGIGIGLAAFFWMTVALEQDAVNLGSLIGQDDNFDYRTHFLSATELLSPAKIMDWAATEPDYALGLGPAQWLLALLGVITLIVGKVGGKKQGVYFALVAALLVFFMLPASRPLWEAIPYLPFLQFPWRLLGPAAFALAVLTAVGVTGVLNINPRRLTRWLPAVFVALIMLSALPLLQVQPWPRDFGPTTALRVVQEELSGRWLGTTSTSDFVPATVDTVPGPVGSLLQDFTFERPLDRVNRHTLFSGTSVQSEEITPLHFRYQTDSDTDFLLRLYLFEFPGWQVTLDGQPAARELGRPEGFIVVPVPDGQHTVEVSFGDTAERRLAYLVSGISAALAIGYAFLLHSKRQMLPADDYVTQGTVRGAGSELLAIALVALGITVLNGVLIEPEGWLRSESPTLTAIPAQIDQFADLDGQVALIGYDAPERVRVGDSLPVNLYWQALRQLDTNYQSFVHLENSAGQLVAQSDALNPGAFPTENWPGDKYVRDEHELELPGDLAPGEYRLLVGLWLPAEGGRLQVVDANGRAVGDRVLLNNAIVVE